MLPPLHDDVMDGPVLKEETRPLSTRKRSNIEENIKRNSVVDGSMSLSDFDALPEYEAVQQPAEVFWDKKTVVFVSWYWPSCVLTGAALGVLVAGLMS